VNDNLYFVVCSIFMFHLQRPSLVALLCYSFTISSKSYFYRFQCFDSNDYIIITVNLFIIYSLPLPFPSPSICQHEHFPSRFRFVDNANKRKLGNARRKIYLSLDFYRNFYFRVSIPQLLCILNEEMGE